MDFNTFSLSRDLLCLSGAFTGIALGLILNAFRKGLNRRSRSRRIALSLLSFSGLVAVFAIAIIVSLGAIFNDPSVFIAAACAVPLCILAARFPRLAAYPLILTGGIVAVWLGYTILRFPPVQFNAEPLAAITHIEGNRYTIKFPAAGDGAKTIQTIQTESSLSSLSFSAAFIFTDPRYPFFGGSARGLITQIRSSAGIIYTSPLNPASTPPHIPFIAGNKPIPGIRTQTLTGQVPFETIPAGVTISINYNGGSFIFTPSSVN